MKLNIQSDVKRDLCTMIRFISFLILFVFTYTLLDFSTAQAQSRLQTISKGASGSKDGGEAEEEEKEKEKDGKSDEKFSGSDSTRRANVSGNRDIVFLGVFENYLPTKKYNARLTVFAEPRKFLLGHRACTKARKIRDQINTYFFKEDLDVDNKGRVNTEGLDEGVRQAIKKALKTKLEYFTSIYVVSGRYNTNKIPKELEGNKVSDCEGVINKKAEMDKANK